MTQASLARNRRGAVLLKLLVPAIAVGVCGVAAWAWLGRSGPGSEAGLDLYEVTRQSFDITTTAAGDLKARKQTMLRSTLETDATIKEIVPEGSRISKGDVLVQLNDDEIQKRLDDETLQLESARAEAVSAENDYAIQLSDNDSALRQANLKVEIAELDLKKWEQGELKEKRLELDLGIDKAQREYDRLKAKVERSEQLFAREFLSKDELDKDRVAYIEAESNLKTAQLAKAVYEEYTYNKDYKKLSSDLAEARSELDRVKRKNESEAASKEASKQNKARQLALREARVDKLKEQVAACTITAPSEGLVVYATSLNENMMFGNNGGPLEIGSQVRPNQELIALPDTSEMIAEAKVSEALVGRVRPGQPAFVTIDAVQNARFSGKVESIGIMAESGGWRDPNVREYVVKIGLELPEGTHGLKPSMRGEARLILATVKDVLAVPVQAVFTDGPNQFVYVHRSDRYHQTAVTVGRRSDSLVEIVSGLEGGEKVILREPPANRTIKTLSSEGAMAAGPGRGPAGKGPMRAGGGMEGQRPGGGMQGQRAGSHEGNNKPASTESAGAEKPSGAAPSAPAAEAAKTGAKADNTETSDAAGSTSDSGSTTSSPTSSPSAG